MINILPTKIPDIDPHLHPGDAYVQDGTRHGWSNHGAEDAAVALVVIGVPAR